MSPVLSVVVGAHNARESIAECLGSIERQRGDRALEVIVVDNSTDGTADLAASGFDRVEVVRSPKAKYIPELWEIGINRSTGDVIALTTAHCVPADNWIASILEAHAKPFAGIAGAIENDDESGLVDWAIYFCRYSRYMLPFDEMQVDDIPGDNASYKRAALELCREARRNGFWEPTVHAQFAKENLRLLLTPSIVVRHRKSFTAPSFARNRFSHGRQYGSDRAKRLGAPQRLVYALLAPAIPFVLLSRISRRVLAGRRHTARWLLSLPVLLVFLVIWSIGELVGYLQGPNQPAPTATP